MQKFGIQIKSEFPLLCPLPVYACSSLGLFSVLTWRLWWKVSSSEAARAGQEAASEWKVSGVRQMLAQWTADRMCVCPFMDLLRTTVAGQGAPNDLRSITFFFFFYASLRFAVGNDDTHLFGSRRGSPWSPLQLSVLRIIIRLIYSAHCRGTSDPHPGYCSCVRALERGVFFFKDHKSKIRLRH